MTTFPQDFPDALTVSPDDRIEFLDISDKSESLLGSRKDTSIAQLLAGSQDLTLEFLSLKGVGEEDAATAAEIITQYDALFNGVSYWAGQISKIQLPGITIGGNSLWSYVFEPYQAEKTIIITATIHGSETKTHQPLKQFLAQLIKDPAKFKMFEKIRLVVCPCMNPDSYGIRRGNGNTPPVDINRNFLIGGSYPTAWSSYSGTGDFYKGTSAFSEVETQAIRYMIEELYADPHAVIDFHNYGNNITDGGEVEVLAIDGWSASDYRNPGLVLNTISDRYSVAATGNLTPDPTLVAYAQQRKTHCVSIELNPVFLKNTNDTDMTKAVNFIANVTAVYAQIPKLIDNINKNSPLLICHDKSASGTKALVANQASRIIIPDSEISFTPKFSGKCFSFFSGTFFPGNNPSSKLIVSPITYQGTLDDTDLVKNEVEFKSFGSSGSRNTNSSMFEIWLEANIATKTALYYRSISSAGTPNIARASIFNLIVPTKDKNLTFAAYIASHPYAKTYEFNNTTPITLSSSQTTNLEIPQLTNYIDVNVRGFILFEFDVLVDVGTNATQQTFILPFCGNTVAIVGSNTDSSVRARRERYTSGFSNSKVQRIKFYHVQHCFPSDKNTARAIPKHTVGLQYRVSNGVSNPVILSSNIKAHIIPSAAGKDLAQWWEWKHTTAVPEQIF